MNILITIPESDYNDLAAKAKKYEQLIDGAETNEKVLVVYNPRSGYQPIWSTIRVSGNGDMFDALNEVLDEIKQSAESERALRMKCQKELIETQRELEKDLKRIKSGLMPQPRKLSFWDRLKSLHR